MKRYGSSNNLADDFGYSYFSGTNKLQTIGEGLTSYGYTYDNNGNMTSDQLNRTGSIKYDHRNLMTEIRVIKSESPSIFDPPVDVLYLTQYRYDEAGNRVRKTRYKYTGSTPDPVFDLSGDAPPWSQQSDEFYVRDVSGKEIAIYSGSSLTQWNIWGLDNVGKINADTTRNYYLKDHLGSIRVVLNSNNAVISAQDYDAWGYPLENRTYNASAMKYDFTGKERDEETSYDYFGARYYDSRIANWTSIDPLFEKHFDYSPYNYVLRNPQKYIDPDGKQVDANEQRANYYLNEDVNLYQKSAEYLDKGIKIGGDILIGSLLGQIGDYGSEKAFKKAGFNGKIGIAVFTIITDIKEVEPMTDALYMFQLDNAIKINKENRERNERYEKELRKKEDGVRKMNEKINKNYKNTKSKRAKSIETYYKGREKNIPK